MLASTCAGELGTNCPSSSSFTPGITCYPRLSKRNTWTPWMPNTRAGQTLLSQTALSQLFFGERKGCCPQAEFPRRKLVCVGTSAAFQDAALLPEGQRLTTHTSFLSRGGRRSGPVLFRVQDVFMGIPKIQASWNRHTFLSFMGESLFYLFLEPFPRTVPACKGDAGIPSLISAELPDDLDLG